MINRSTYVLFLFAMLFSLSSWANIGSLLLVTGEVNIVRADQTIPAQNGAELFEKDKVMTQAGARAQLRFSDDTVITLGANTEFGIEAFLNEGASRSKAEFSVAKGTFKAITGRVGKVAPDNFKLQTKTATIGIRGTIFSGNIQPDRELIATLRGRIRVTDNLSGFSVDVPAGFMTQINPGEPPQPPRPLSADELDELGNTDQGESVNNQNSDDSNEAGQGGDDAPPPLLGSTPPPPPPLLTEPDTSQLLNNLQDDKLQNDQLALQIDQNTSLEVFGWKPYSYEPEFFTITNENLIGTFDNHIGWGEWEAYDPQSGSYTDYWVGGTEAAEAASYIDSLSSGGGGTYTYTGKVMGDVWYSEVTSVAINTADSLVVLTADFSSIPTISGSMQFNTGIDSPNWNMEFTTSNIEGGMFSAGLTGNGVEGNIEGLFYGSQANSVGGVFGASDDSWNHASGVFKATR